MKHFSTFKSSLWRGILSLLLLVTMVGNVWGDTIVFDFEDNTAHRTSGTNSYSSNSYTENGATITMTYFDAVSSTKVSGSYNATGRVAKNTTNSPVLLIGPIDINNKKVTGISYTQMGATAISQVLQYSTDNSNWTTGVASFSTTSSKQEKATATLNVTGDNLYIKITGSVSSSTGSNRDFYVDDVTVTYEEVSANTATAPILPASGVFTTATYDVTITNGETGATVYYTTDGTAPTTSSTNFTGASTSFSINATTTVKAMAVIDGKSNSSVTTATYTKEASIANTAETAYTVAEAKALIDANSSQLTTTKVYVKGTISKIEKYDETDKFITYWLDDNAFEVYKGKGANGAAFASIDDIHVDGTVVVYGIIKKFNSTYELDEGSWLTSYVAPAVVKTTPTLTLATYKTALHAGESDQFAVTYNGDATIVVTSSSSDVAEVNIVDGTVTVSALKEGSTKITVSVAETDNYYAASKYYTLTVSKAPEAFDAAVHTALVAEKDGSFYAAANTLEGTNKFFAVTKVRVIDGKVYGVEAPSKYAWKVTTTENAATIENLEGKYLSLATGSTNANLSTDKVSLYAKDGVFYAEEGGRAFAYNSSSSRMASYSATYPAAKSIPFATDMYYTRSVTSGKYGTICLPYAVAEGAITGAEFYTATVNGNYVTLESVTALEAGKPYIFLATDNSIKVEMSGTPVGDVIANGSLTGVLVDTKVPEGSYVMQTKEGVQSFYKVEGTLTLSANRAYLTASTSDARILGIGATATAIKAIEALTSGDARIYDANGRQMKNLQRGINIVNGVKVIVK